MEYAWFQNRIGHAVQSGRCCDATTEASRTLVPIPAAFSTGPGRPRQTDSVDALEARGNSPRFFAVPSKDDAIRRVRRTKRRCRAGLPWTSREEELIIELYPTHNNRDLAVRLGRSEWAISGKARALGLARDLDGGYRRRRSEGRPWLQGEIGLLRRLYPIMPYEEVAEKLGRSHDAVKMKARKLELRKIEFWSEQEDQLLRDSYQTQSYDQVAQRLGRTLLAVKARAITLELEVKVLNWTEDEIRFLRNSYGVIELNVIAKALRRTRAATAKKAREMGLVQWRHWSAEEVQRLTELYPHFTMRELSDRLGRSYETIRYKASRLGLRKQSQPVESSKIFIAP